jgi:hypothetical protein
MDKTLPLLINSEVGLELSSDISLDELREQLSVHIEKLIQTDFNRLLSILYRIDVNENKLRNILKENPGSNASIIIADCIIERQLQKIKSRKEQTPRDNNIDEKDSW